MKVAGRSALVQIAPSTQQITAHAGLVLVRELAERLGLAELLDRITVKQRRRVTARLKRCSDSARR